MSPVRLPLAGGGWLRYRRVGDSGKALVTAADGRFLLIDSADVDAARRGADDPDDPTRSRLDQLGFVHHDGPGAAPEPLPSSGHHVVYLSAGDGAVMDAEVARGVVASMFATRPSYVNLELRGLEPVVAAGTVRTLLALARQEAGAYGAGLSVSVSTEGGSEEQALEYLADAGVAWNVRAPVPGADAFRTVERLHELYRARGIDARLAYVTAVVTVTRPVLEASPRSLVEACLAHGVVYVLIRPSGPAGPEATACTADEFRAFQRGMSEAVLDANVAGRFLVDKRLALHLEALTAGLSGPAPELAAYAPDGRVFASAAGPLLVAGGDERDRIGTIADSAAELASGRRAWRGRIGLEPGGEATCRSCVYDPYCDGALLRAYLMEDEVAPRSPGSALCDRSMGSFDDVFALLASPAATKLRRVFADWTRARRDVARRLSTGGRARGSA